MESVVVQAWRASTLLDTIINMRLLNLYIWPPKFKFR
jgi:hypothetical protein